MKFLKYALLCLLAGVAIGFFIERLVVAGTGTSSTPRIEKAPAAPVDISKKVIDLCAIATTSYEEAKTRWGKNFKKLRPSRPVLNL